MKWVSLGIRWIILLPVATFFFLLPVAGVYFLFDGPLHYYYWLLLFLYIVAFAFGSSLGMGIGINFMPLNRRIMACLFLTMFFSFGIGFIEAYMVTTELEQRQVITWTICLSVSLIVIFSSAIYHLVNTWTLMTLTRE